MIRTLLIDDEAPARDELRYLLTTNHSDVIDIIGEADNATAAISLITREKPALIFLDIHMRGLSGLELAQVIHDISPDSKIIFATAYDEYALKAFELQALDYVVKPIEDDRLAKAVGHVQKLLGNSIKTAPSNTTFNTTSNATSSTSTASGNGSNKTLTELQERLKGTSLFRVHRSYIVNLNKVQEVIPWFKGTYWLRLPQQTAKGQELTDIPVSKAQVKLIKELLDIS